MAKQKQNVMAVVQKEYPEFANVVDNLDVLELDKKIAVYAKELEKVQDDFNKNEEIQKELEGLKERENYLKEPLKEAQKAIKLKIKYLILLVKDRGGDA